MSRDLADLTDEFRAKVEELLQNCHAKGFEMKPCWTLRTPMEQATLWQQSRTDTEVSVGVQMLKDRGAPWLASVLAACPRQFGKVEVTKALPGASWHHFGEAVDCYWDYNGIARWGGPAFDVYKQEAMKLGLTPLSFERVHVQLRSQGSPSALWVWPDIDGRLKEKFGP